MSDKEEELVRYEGADITKPICEPEQLKKLASEGKFPIPFISNATIGWGYIRKTDRMKKATLKQQCSGTYGKQYSALYPERVIRDIVIDYCNRFPFPEMLMQRIKKDIEVNIKFKETKGDKDGKIIRP